MRTEPAEVFDDDPGHADTVGQDPPHRVGVQRTVADAVPGADSSK
jgi:hypothetical protein